jgi:aryl-alcohol dehydrogenase-like predicted oxidoreductase
MPACRELGIVFVPFSPLGRGFLTGTVAGREAIAPNDWRANNPRFSGDNLSRNLALLRPLEEIGQAHRAKPAQVALAWVLSRGENVIPIPGMKRRTHLDENVAALDIELTPDELARLDAVFSLSAAAGERYTPEVARWAGR